jgi:hypothetical protein
MASPRYKFVGLESADSLPLAVQSAARSHAIRTGLQHGSMILGSQGAQQSRETVKHKNLLKGRFRLSGATTQGFGSSAEKAKERSQEWPSSGSLEVPAPGR